MRTLIRGTIRNLVPSFSASVDEDGTLILREDGNLSMTVDTGFTGGIALPEEILETMNVQLVSHGLFRLATGNEVELPMYWGQVFVEDHKTETWFIPGDMLIGMEFLSSAGTMLSIDFRREEVSLMVEESRRRQRSIRQRDEK